MISYNYLFKIFIKIFIILYELSFTIIEKTAKIDQTELFDSLVNISNFGYKIYSLIILFRCHSHRLNQMGIYRPSYNNNTQNRDRTWLINNWITPTNEWISLSHSRQLVLLRNKASLTINLNFKQQASATICFFKVRKYPRLKKNVKKNTIL